MEGTGPLPYDWLISCICKEFGCLPSAAREETDIDLVLRIMDDRAYARAKHTIETTKMDDLPDDPMIGLVQEIQFDIARERKARRAKHG